MSTTPLLPDDRRSLTLRLSFMQYLVTAAFAALAIGFWIFQIAQHQRFLEMAEENLRRVMGVVRQKSAAAKPSDPEAQALLAILRANGPGEGQEGEDSERPSSS